MARVAAWLECFDDHHAAAATWAAMVKLPVVAGFQSWLGARRNLGCCCDELAGTGELFGPGNAAVGEQAVVANAMESLGQHVHQEPTPIPHAHLSFPHSNSDPNCPSSA